MATPSMGSQFSMHVTRPLKEHLMSHKKGIRHNHIIYSKNSVIEYMFYIKRLTLLQVKT